MLGRHLQLPFKEYCYHDTLRLDFYPSVQPGLRPCVIVVHGGSWAGGNSRQLPELNSVLANNGYHVAAINYRLAPACKSPGQVEDVRNAIAYLKSNARELGIDSTKLILLGRSAGAQITLVAAYTLHDPAIIGTISYYGPADMVWGYSLAANPLVFDSRKVMVDYLGGTYNEVPQNYFNSSPIEFATPQSPPTLLIHGPLDPLVAYDHSVRLNKQLEALNVPHYFLDLPCGTHGCDYTLNGPSGQVATYTVLGFLDRVCNCQ
jgi:acetyl esterase/lipase